MSEVLLGDVLETEKGVVGDEEFEVVEGYAGLGEFWDAEGFVGDAEDVRFVLVFVVIHLVEE